MLAFRGQPPVSDNDWEKITGQGDDAIKGDRRPAVRAVALLFCRNSDTASRKWVNYEIDEAWKKGMGAAGVHIHGLKDASQNQSTKGPAPSAVIGGSTPMSSIEAV